MDFEDFYRWALTSFQGSRDSTSARHSSGRARKRRGGRQERLPSRRFECLEDRRLLSSWSMSQDDMGHTGRAAYTIAASRLNSHLFSDFLWQTRSPGALGCGLESMPFFDGVGPGGTDLVVGTYHWPKGIQGMDAQTGQIYWTGDPSGGE